MYPEVSVRSLSSSSAMYGVSDYGAVRVLKHTSQKGMFFLQGERLYCMSQSLLFLFWIATNR